MAVHKLNTLDDICALIGGVDGVLKFSPLNKRLISRFVEFKSYCYAQEKFVIPIAYAINREHIPNLQISTFYSHMRDVCDISILFLVNEELSNSINKCNYPALINEIFAEYPFLIKNLNNDNSQISIKDQLFNSSKDLSHLLTDGFNPIIGSQILDAEVSLFSAFEFWVSKIFDSLRPESYNFILQSKSKKIEKELAKYFSGVEVGKISRAAQALAEPQCKNPPFFEIFNFILNKIGKEKYKRDQKLDRKVIDFLRAKRNTVHNGGLYMGREEMRLELGAFKQDLFPGQPIGIEDFAEFLTPYKFVVDIYSNICGYVKSEMQEDFLCMFNVEADLNWMMFPSFILECVKNNDKTYLEEYKERFGISKEQFDRIISNVQSYRNLLDSRQA